MILSKLLKLKLYCSKSKIATSFFFLFFSLLLKEFQAIENPRKRRIEVNDYINEKGFINNLVSNISGVNEWTSKKKKEEVAIGFKDRQWSYEDKEEGREVHKEKV